MSKTTLIPKTGSDRGWGIWFTFGILSNNTFTTKMLRWYEKLYDYGIKRLVRSSRKLIFRQKVSLFYQKNSFSLKVFYFPFHGFIMRFCSDDRGLYLIRELALHNSKQRFCSIHNLPSSRLSSILSSCRQSKISKIILRFAWHTTANCLLDYRTKCLALNKDNNFH